MMELTDANVKKVYREVMCDENNPNFRQMNMIANPFGIDMVKLEEHRQDVIDLLNQLPEEFFPDTGGGWSFLNACNRRDGVQWTGMHLVMESLFAMGMALGMVEFMMDREMWPIFPGGVPYLLVDTSGIKKEENDIPRGDVEQGYEENPEPAEPNEPRPNYDSLQELCQGASPARYGATGDYPDTDDHGEEDDTDATEPEDPSEY